MRHRLHGVAGIGSNLGVFSSRVGVLYARPAVGIEVGGQIKRREAGGDVLVCSEARELVLAAVGDWWAQGRDATIIVAACGPA